MNKQIHFVLIITLLGFCSRTQAVALTVCIEDQLYIPFIDSNEQKLGDGVLVSLVNQSVPKNLFQVQFIRQSWPRCVEKVASGELHALMAMVYTPQRAKLVVFPEGAEQPHPKVYLWQVRYPFFIKEGQAFNLLQLEIGPRFGIGTPYKYVTYQILEQKNLLPLYDYDLETGLAMVAAGRLDAYVVETLIGLNAVKKLQLQQQIVTTKEALLESYWHIVFNPGYYGRHKQNIDEFWANLAEVRLSLISKMNEKN